MSEPLTMSSRKYAKYSGFPWRTVVQWCRQGLLPHNRVSNGYFIWVDEADRILKEQAMANAGQRAEKVQNSSKVIRIDRNTSFAEKVAALKSRTTGQAAKQA